MLIFSILLTFCALGITMYTFTAGLPYYAVSIAGMAMSAAFAVATGAEAFGLILYFAVIVMVINSHSIMKQYALGPYRS